jgi:hypothetical protein
MNVRRDGYFKGTHTFANVTKKLNIENREVRNQSRAEAEGQHLKRKWHSCAWREHSYSFLEGRNWNASKSGDNSSLFNS